MSLQFTNAFEGNDEHCQHGELRSACLLCELISILRRTDATMVVVADEQSSPAKLDLAPPTTDPSRTRLN